MKIICVGRNYAEHAKEMKSEVPGDPVIFMKPDTSLLLNNADFYLPEFSNDVHHELEIVYRISREGKFIQPRFAVEYLDGIGLGIDFTARDLQSKLKEKSLPWTLAKGFNNAAPVSNFLPMETFPDHRQLNFHLHLNGIEKQKGNSSDMIFSIENLVAFITKYITLKKGDMIFTGTPAGVGAVKAGDRLEGWMENHKLLDFLVK